MINTSTNNRISEYDLLRLYPDIFHFVTTRQGGYSEGSYASFNCNPYSGDKREAVLKNQKVLLNLFPTPPQEFIIPIQIHGTSILHIDSSFSSLSTAEKQERLQGIDALITPEKNICICISTADCVPILLYNPIQQVVSAIHAGWRGTVNRITEKTVREMISGYNSRPENIVACIGPSISPESFEVGNKVWELFAQEGFDMDLISHRNPFTDKWHIDLWEANRKQLTENGVNPSYIELANICTYQNSDRYFSARKLGINSGRILSGIMMIGADRNNIIR